MLGKPSLSSMSEAFNLRTWFPEIFSKNSAGHPIASIRRESFDLDLANPTTYKPESYDFHEAQINIAIMISSHFRCVPVHIPACRLQVVLRLSHFLREAAVT